MHTKLVYLRPKPVAYVRVEGHASTASDLAWQKLYDWCRETQMSDLISTGYGMVSSPPRSKDRDMSVYEAAIEIPFQDFQPNQYGLAVRQLPGGAYLRRRTSGGLDTVPRATTMHGQRPTVDDGLELDTTRPVIEIFLSNPWASDREQKMELLLPISVAARSAA